MADKNTKVADKNTKVADKNTKVADKNTKVADKNTKVADKNSSGCLKGHRPFAYLFCCLSANFDEFLLMINILISIEYLLDIY